MQHSELGGPQYTHEQAERSESTNARKKLPTFLPHTYRYRTLPVLDRVSWAFSRSPNAESAGGAVCNLIRNRTRPHASLTAAAIAGSSSNSHQHFPAKYFSWFSALSGHRIVVLVQNYGLNYRQK